LLKEVLNKKPLVNEFMEKHSNQKGIKGGGKN